MVELTRTLRFSLGDHPPADGPDEVRNAFGGWPRAGGLAIYGELDVTCAGRPDPRTGFFINIRDIDAAVRDIAFPILHRAAQRDGPSDPRVVLPRLAEALAPALRGLSRLRWRLTPTHSLEVETRRMTACIIRQSFDFAAAHRLHVPALSDDENRRVFGLCNNPRGHGHNYRIEPAVEVGPADRSPAFTLADLERATMTTVIRRFDHKHLNEDTPEFNGQTGLNPTVENIARICFDMLRDELSRHPSRPRLRCVTVWETDRTSCTYPAPGAVE